MKSLVESLVEKAKTTTFVGIPDRNVMLSLAEPDWYFIVASGYFLICKTGDVETELQANLVPA